MINPVIGGALIGAGANLLGGLFGIGSQAKANKANILMNRENNNLQRELANQKYAKDLEQWNRENAYNTPLAQRNRLLEAGFNPALQNISPGQAQSSPEMALAQTTPGQVAPLTDGSFVGRAGESVFASMSAMEDIRSKNIDNRTRATENLIRIQSLGEQMKGSKLKNYFQQLQNDAFGVLNELEVSSRRQNIEMQKYQIEQQIADNALLNKQLSVFDRNQQIFIQKSIAEIALLGAQRGLSDAQIGNLVVQNDYIREQINSLGLDNNVKKRTMTFVISSAASAARKARFESYPSFEQLDNYSHYLHKFGDENERSKFKFNFRQGSYKAGRWLNDILPKLFK